jgi:hypothetical protein
VLYAVSGSLHIPGRFAIDWTKVDKSSKYFHGNSSSVKDWNGYGAEVLAVSDSIVAAIRDDVPESTTLDKNPPRVWRPARGPSVWPNPHMTASITLMLSKTVCWTMNILAVRVEQRR